MQIIEKYRGDFGEEIIFEYSDADSFNMPIEKCRQVYGIAFHKDKFLVVNNILHPGSYTPIGGSVEKGERPDDALTREIKEESNMKVLEFRPIGYQKVIDTSGKEEPYYQLRYFCIVKPYGPFVSDPAGKVTEIVECNPKEYKKYFDWGRIGERIMERAIEFRSTTAGY